MQAALCQGCYAEWQVPWVWLAWRSSSEVLPSHGGQQRPRAVLSLLCLLGCARSDAAWLCVLPQLPGSWPQLPAEVAGDVIWEYLVW